MKLAFYCNYLNHHQVLVADELYKILGNEYCFVATLPRNVNELKGGDDYSSRPYCILAGESDDARNYGMQLAREAETCIFGACSQEYAVERAKQLDCGLSFEVAERWLKNGFLTIGSPVFRNWLKNYFVYYRKKKFYKLCSSAFAASDDNKMHIYIGRHFKWAYFSEVPESFPVHTETDTIRLMWCARFIAFKHPELAIKCSKRLADKGLNFHLDMYGDGELRPKMEKLSECWGLSELISFHGNIPNEKIIASMRESDVFLFTSDKKEGWGVVANEAMANGCVVLGRDCIGSVPYLINNSVDGFYFSDIDGLCEKIEWLIANRAEMENMKKRAYESMRKLWNPYNAAKSLLRLINDINDGRESSIQEGPCSKA